MMRDLNKAWQSGGDVRSVPFTTHPCECRSEHAPEPLWTHRHHLWPLYAGGPDTEENAVYVCPATHDWIHKIWREFAQAGYVFGRRRGWPHLAYDLAKRGWFMMEDAGGE